MVVVAVVAVDWEAGIMLTIIDTIIVVVMVVVVVVVHHHHP